MADNLTSRREEKSSRKSDGGQVEDDRHLVKVSDVRFQASYPAAESQGNS